MILRNLGVAVLLLLSGTICELAAQTYRPINGSGVNATQPAWGALHSDMVRIAPAAYADGISSPAAVNRANPRTISNKIVHQEESKGSHHKYSDFVWVFGQIVDHDITLISTDANQAYPVQVPACDEMFDPNCDGFGIIPINRSTQKDGTGTSVDNPRNYVNEITAWVDCSNVYGSDEERMNWLRTFEDGKLKTSSNKLLPFNTIDEEFNSPIDSDAPFMDNPNRFTNRLYVAGDIRANENINLTVMHTLFMREHNRICDQLQAENAQWNDEKLFQEARKRVIAKMQAILYYEWLPTIGVEMPDYFGYDETVNPNISVTFSAAAYRMGHSLINRRILRMDDYCNHMTGGDLELREAFFNPRLLDAEGDIEPFLKGMSYQIQQEFDCQLNQDIRNFLFGPPEAGIGMDLAAINIQRGREEGLPDFNSVREAFGLSAYTSFEEINPDPNVYMSMQEVYGDINDVDAWVGMLAETHIDGAMFGETVMEVLREQFERLRVGDSYYFENDPSFTIDEIESLKSTTLRDIIMKNSSLQLMQKNVFKADPMCVPVDISGKDLNMYAFPNPTPDYYSLGIYTYEAEEATYSIFDLSGKLVDQMTLQLEKGMNTYSMALNSNIPAGVYTLSIQRGDRKSAIKIQKIGS